MFEIKYSIKAKNTINQIFRIRGRMLLKRPTPTPLFSIILITSMILSSCQEVSNDKLFSEMPSASTGIDFENKLDFKNPDFNIYRYRNFYNGGGVAMGDVNGDGLLDVYMTANQQENKLYLNEGDFKFNDITSVAGVGGTRAWSTGVSMADVNGDGLLDIYICNSGGINGEDKQNELFINQGMKGDTPLFVEEAEKYGLADKGYSTHAAFFDYDKDGDLDCYLLNNSYQDIGSFNLEKNERPKRDEVGGDKLLRNDGDSFTDVSEEAGIYGSVIGFGLGVTVGDINFDGWQDIYVSNDFFERDYIYINNQDGTFTEELEKEIKSISAASMGADMADMNNDGLPEIFVTEMLPEPNDRVKTVTTFESWDKYQTKLATGYYHQYTRNMFHVHNGVSDIYNNKGKVTFSEIGRLAGVHATDWSWGALMADYNNDGNKDLFIANGIYQDLTNQDFLNFFANDKNKLSMITDGKVDYGKLVDVMPSVKIKNYMYENNGNLNFTNQAEAWGLATASHSNGSAYGDLDNDGDLDLVVNNVNMPCFVYRNNTETMLKDNHYLKFDLQGKGKNTQAVGAKVTIKHGGEIYYLEQMPIRGFQSTVDFRPNFGLGTLTKVDSVIVEWYNSDAITIMTNVPTNQTLKLKESEAKAGKWFKNTRAKTTLKNITATLPIDYQHIENKFVDFDRERLLYQMRSTEGPKVAVGDVNGDGKEDFYVGGAKDSAGKLFIQTGNGFQISAQVAFENDKMSEDLGCIFFDADGDNDMDLYVTSGGSEFSPSALSLYDRLYFNNNGRFEKSSQQFPEKRLAATSCVTAGDYDGDGDMDLFVGSRLRSFLFGVPVNGYILQNDGKGNFTDVSPTIAEDLKEIGLITDAKWADIDGDKDLDLVIVGEWMGVTILKNNSEGSGIKFTKTTIENSNGWWNTMEMADLDNDGDMDFVVGNHGLNSRFKTSVEHPACIYINDFDQNGTAEQIICTYNGDNAYPMTLRHDLVMQMPHLKKKYLKYDSYKNATIKDMFSEKEMEKTVIHKAHTFETAILINDGKGNFTLKALPKAAQNTPIYAILVKDVDGDNQVDILLGGNLYAAKPEVGRYDANYGLVLKGNGKGDFAPVQTTTSGFFVDGELRDLASVKVGEKNVVLAVRNNDGIVVFE